MSTSSPSCPKLYTPTIKRRLASLVYESLLLAAILFIAGYIVVGLRPIEHTGFFRVYLLLVCGVYLVWFWRHGGQTLPMKTWRIRLVDASGGPVGLGQAWLRYACAVGGLAALGLGFLWAVLDRDRQFLHDRLAGTRLVLCVRADDAEPGSD